MKPVNRRVIKNPHYHKKNLMRVNRSVNRRNQTLERRNRQLLEMARALQQRLDVYQRLAGDLSEQLDAIVEPWERAS